MRTRAAQRGWAGLVGLLIALVIVLVLGRTVLQQMGLATAGAASTPMSRQLAPEPASTQAASSQLRVTAPIERARSVEATVQQQARDAAANVERSTQ